jgi:hypothetical protein
MAISPKVAKIGHIFENLNISAKTYPNKKIGPV